ncbi:MAG TPA: branched-chain amino acid ABC transporter permease [Nevskiaceae bacterium]|nr:branched-chain amino acid ABC transporter permease [Nevskiaceae bacterium]
MFLHDLVTLVFSGLTSASLLFLVAAGLTLIFGAMHIVNIAHGSFYMLAAFVVTSLTSAAAAHSAALFWIALVVAPLVIGALGAVTEILILRRLYGREPLLGLLATFGLLYLLEGIALLVWGGGYHSIPIPPALQGHLTIIGSSLSIYNLFVIAVAIAIGLFLWWLLQRTRLGWRVRAAVEDPETLAASGTNVRLLFTGVFTLGVILAGIAGAVTGPIESITTGLGPQILVEAFIVVVIGGLGSVPGAAIGAVLIGLFETGGVMWAPSFASAFIYIAMIVVLIVRPSGLLGITERVS